MNYTEQTLTHFFSAVVMAGMLALCLRSRGEATVVSGRRTYHVHSGWYVFCAIGGVFLVGIFAYASATTIQADKSMAAWCSVISALLFTFTAAVLRAASVTIDDDQLISSTLFGERRVAFSDVENVVVAGLSVQIRMRRDPQTNKKRRSLSFIAAFAGLGELLATVRARTGQAGTGRPPTGQRK